MISAESAESRPSPLVPVASRALDTAATAKGGQLRGGREEEKGTGHPRTAQVRARSPYN
jgi:hypothetical protein